MCCSCLEVGYWALYSMFAIAIALFCTALPLSRNFEQRCRQPDHIGDDEKDVLNLTKMDVGQWHRYLRKRRIDPSTMKNTKLTLDVLRLDLGLSRRKF